MSGEYIKENIDIVLADIKAKCGNFLNDNGVVERQDYGHNHVYSFTNIAVGDNGEKIFYRIYLSADLNPGGA